MKKHIWLGRIMSAAIWLVVWQLASVLTGLELLLASPVSVFLRLCELIVDWNSIRIVLGSCGNILTGFLIGMLIGSVLAVGAKSFWWLKELVAVPVSVCKSLPMASFIILLIIWFGSGRVAMLTAIIVTVPLIYSGVYTGLAMRDDKLDELCSVYKVAAIRRFLVIELPKVYNIALGDIKLAAGMSWKAAVSAEVIGLSVASIGEQFYYSKLYFETDSLFAWSILVIICSVLMEKAVVALLTYAIAYIRKSELGTGRLKDRVGNDGNKPNEQAVRIQDVSKSYDSHMVIRDFSLDVRTGERICLYGESGIGKTTLFRMISGLEVPDSGEVQLTGSLAYVFQEDRLVWDMSAIENVLLVAPGRRKEARWLLERLLPEDAIDMCVSKLSGGMRRRVSLAMGLVLRPGVLLLDEFLSGLDDANKLIVCELINEYVPDSTVIMVSHDIAEIEAMGARVVAYPLCS